MAVHVFRFKRCVFFQRPSSPGCFPTGKIVFHGDSGGQTSNGGAKPKHETSVNQELLQLGNFGETTSQPKKKKKKKFFGEGLVVGCQKSRVWKVIYIYHNPQHVCLILEMTHTRIGNVKMICKELELALQSEWLFVVEAVVLVHSYNTFILYSRHDVTSTISYRRKLFLMVKSFSLSVGSCLLNV